MQGSFAMNRRIKKACQARRCLACGTVFLALFLMGFEKAPSNTRVEKMHGGNDQENCVWSFHSYEPSKWEKEWRDGEESGLRRNSECEVLAQQVETARSVQLITAVTGLMLEATMPPPEAIPLFSRMIYARRCGPTLKDTGQRRVQLIEPLIGLLRDPLTICRRPVGVDDKIYQTFSAGEGALQSKRHLLLGPAAPWTETPDDPKSWRVGGFTPGAIYAGNSTGPRTRRNILMDIGASLYDHWRSDFTAASASWFVDRFKRQGQSFDWIISFEINKYDPDMIYQNVPDDIVPHYLYYNQGVDKNPDGKWNPWRILQGMGASPDDYVAIKLDIDVPEIENALIDQLVNEPKIQALADEVFFEQHVNVKAMWSKWKTQNDPLTLKDTYRLFGNLRSKGVRMHGWP